MGNNGNSERHYFRGSKTTADGDCSHEIKRHLLLGIKAMTNLIQFSSVQLLSRVQLFATPWTAAYQAPPSMGFSRQEYWSGVPLLEPPKIKSDTVSTVSPSISHEVMGPDAMILTLVAV